MRSTLATLLLSFATAHGSISTPDQCPSTFQRYSRRESDRGQSRGNPDDPQHREEVPLPGDERASLHPGSSFDSLAGHGSDRQAHWCAGNAG